jgi:hypothetical protein
MTEQYNKQDGSPEKDSDQTVSVPDDARPATVGERSTQENMAGQGLGQMPDEDAEKREHSPKP